MTHRIRSRSRKKFVCDFGVFKGKTMEQVLESGVKGNRNHEMDRK